MSGTTRARILAALAVAFALRVLGQLVVVLFEPRWLPPLPFWRSGLIGYPLLLTAQVAILALMTTVVRASRTAADAWRPRSWLASRMRAFAALYGTGMALRPPLTLLLAPELHPAQHLIPSLFHVVLASFLWIWAGPAANRGSGRVRASCSSDSY